MKKREKNIVYRRLIQSYLSSVISISMVLLLAGLTGLLAVNAKAVSAYFKENIKISVIFEEIASDEEAKQVFEKLSNKKYVKKADYISKEQGAKEMKEILGEDFLDLFDVNPIPISIDLLLKANYLESDSLALIEKELSSFLLVREVVYQDSLVKVINDNVEKVGYVSAVLIVLLMFISFVLINNTVRLNLYSKRFVVYTMKLVGAKRSFIRKPLLVKGVWQGLISSVISVGLIVVVIYMMERDLPQLFEILDLRMIAVVLAAVPVLGVVLCLVSTFFIANRLVSMSGDDIYY
ncbi:MAG: permease-like cell division protein FtsX [Bacteroidales bacterium]|nr:permease-like cell division protein FtsX [Bacteroidales bacterium]